MKAFLAFAFTGLLTASCAFAGPVEPQQGYPIGGLGDAWFQNQSTSIGISNGYDPQKQTYTVPGNPPYTVRSQGLSGASR